MARVKCNRCDRYYSGMHLKCPYCGAHRSKKTVRKEQEEMSNAKFVIGGIVLIALIAAVVVLLIVSLSGGDSKPKSDATDDTPEYVQDEGVDSLEGESAGDDTPEDGTSEDGTAPEGSTPEDGAAITTPDDQTGTDLVINSVKIVLYGEEKTDVTVYIGDVYDFGFETDPETVDETATWTSDDESVAVVLPNGEVTIVGEGTTFINCTVGGKTGSMLVRAKA